MKEEKKMGLGKTPAVLGISQKGLVIPNKQRVRDEER